MAEQKAKSIHSMSLPEDRDENLRMAQINPSFLLTGATPRLIDEWQIAPEI